MTTIPTPEETGSDGTQQAGIPDIVPIEQISPLHGLPITQVIEGLAATRSRNMGGEIGASLIAGSFTQLSHDLQETKHDLQVTRKELGIAKEELSNSKIKAAVLQERVGNLIREKHLKNFSITVGTVIIGIGIEIFRNNFVDLSYITIGLGSFLILFGWYSRDGGDDK